MTTDMQKLPTNKNFRRFYYYNDCIIDYFCTEPLKPLVMHTPL